MAMYKGIDILNEILVTAESCLPSLIIYKKNYTSLANLLAIHSWKGHKFTFCPVFKATALKTSRLIKTLDSTLVLEKI